MHYFIRSFCRFLKLIIAVLILLFNTERVSASEPDKVKLQLRWFHQFQFAGYYAAIEKGFYSTEELDVEIIEGGEGKDPVQKVLAGEAEFGVTNSEIILHRFMGEPLVAVAAIFQHSPLVLLTYADSPVFSPHDLIGRKVMMMPGTRDVEILAMFQNEGISLKMIEAVDARFRMSDYLDKNIYAHSAYITNQPYFLKESGIPVRILYPVQYGIDFYGDCIFTSQKIAESNHDMVKRFRKASLAGWDYAMSHKEEMINIILSKYKSGKGYNHLSYEADQMEKLILPGLVETGHMNPGRWRHIADTFVKLGMAPQDYSIDGFIFDPDPKMDYKKVRTMAVIFILIVSGVAVVALFLFSFNKRLQYEIEEHLKAENDLKTTNSMLEKALNEVKILRGIVPICANCKKIRDDEGYWHEVEEYISRHTDAALSHGICPECMDELYPVTIKK